MQTFRGKHPENYVLKTQKFRVKISKHCILKNTQKFRVKKSKHFLV